MEPQSVWHGMYIRRLLDDYVSHCVDPKPSFHHDAKRPATDGTHVPNYSDDGWTLLLGAPSRKPAFGTRRHADRLVLDRDAVMAAEPMSRN